MNVYYEDKDLEELCEHNKGKYFKLLSQYCRNSIAMAISVAYNAINIDDISKLFDIWKDNNRYYISVDENKLLVMDIVLGNIENKDNKMDIKENNVSVICLEETDIIFKQTKMEELEIEAR